MTRIRRVESQRELERLLDEFVTKGYKIQNQGQYSAKVKEKDWGSPPVHVFVFLFSLLVGALLFNAADASAEGAWLIAIIASVTYTGYSWITSEEVVIKIDEEDDEERHEVAESLEDQQVAEVGGTPENEEVTESGEATENAGVEKGERFEEVEEEEGFRGFESSR